ncbi:MAG: hypothetical protein H7Y12_01715, partial [Sphingobacteriaceae bacterium]|nr:hypothetical protein [Cytophagaceae bacterium]
QNDSRLDPAYVKNTLRYLDDFYAEINNPTTVQTIFQSNARRVPIKKTPAAVPKKKSSPAIAPGTKKPAVKQK